MIRRTHTLVVFNTNSAAVTTDSTPRTSEYCADEYAYTRGYCSTRGQYWKIGADFGGIAVGKGHSTQPSYSVMRDVTVTSSYSPGMSPAVNNTRYYGQTLAVAIANMVADGELDAIFIESLVPNDDDWLAYPGYTYQGNCPSGRVMGSAPYIAQYPLVLYQNNGYGKGGDGFSDASKKVFNIKANNWIKNNRTTQLPYGRIGWPGCTFADIQRLAADANWGESQNNLSKDHAIGGTNYTAGGDTWHMVEAFNTFAASVNHSNLYFFDESVPSGYYTVGTQLSYSDFNWGSLSPVIDVFGLLFSKFPQTGGTPDHAFNTTSWTAKRGAWAYNWSSAAVHVGYDVLEKGGTASILCENEPGSNGIAATDCVAYALMKGLTMAEANFLSGLMSVCNSTAYGAPDYAPYALTNSISLEEDIDMSVQGLKLSWVSSSAIDVGPGQAVVESLGYAVGVSSTIHKTGLTGLGNNAWGYVYLKDDGTIAVSTTGPSSTPFMATGKSKTSDTTQRFIGVIRTDGSGNIRPFEHDLAEGRFRYVNANVGYGSNPFRVLSNGNAMSSTAIDVRSQVPPESERCDVIVHNCSTNGGIVFVSNGRYTVSTSVFDFLALGASTGIVSLPYVVGCDATSANGLKYICDATGGSAYIDVHGFYIDR